MPGPLCAEALTVPAQKGVHRGAGRPPMGPFPETMRRLGVRKCDAHPSSFLNALDRRDRPKAGEERDQGLLLGVPG